MVYLFLADGFEEIEALTPVDLLRRAGIEVTTVGIGGTTVTGAHGITVFADMSQADATARIGEDMEMVILPGGMPGTKNLDASATVSAFLAVCRIQNIPVAAICAAPMILGKRGMLRNKNAVCYPGFEEYLDGATVLDRGVVRDGNVICGRAMGSASEFAIEIIRLLRGDEAAEKIASSVLL